MATLVNVCSRACRRPARSLRTYALPSAPYSSSSPSAPAPRSWGTSTGTPSRKSSPITKVLGALHNPTAPPRHRSRPSSIDTEEDDAEPESTPYLTTNSPFPRPPTPKEFIRHRDTMKRSFPEGWSPARKVSREAMDGLRTLHAHDPEMFSTPVLAARFKISPEAVRRILKSKWEPDEKRKAKMAVKEVQARSAWIAERKANVRQKRSVQEPAVEVEDREIPEMFMDSETDVDFVGSDTPRSRTARKTHL